MILIIILIRLKATLKYSGLHYKRKTAIFSEERNLCKNAQTSQVLFLIRTIIDDKHVLLVMNI